MAPIAAILGGISGTFGFLVAMLCFDAGWTSAIATYFLAASGTFCSVLVLCALQRSTQNMSRFLEKAESGAAIRF